MWDVQWRDMSDMTCRQTSNGRPTADAPGRLVPNAQQLDALGRHAAVAGVIKDFLGASRLCSGPL